MNDHDEENPATLDNMIHDLLVKKGREPAAAHRVLSHFKEVSWPAPNSFVHGGVHALSRSVNGRMQEQSGQQSANSR